MKKIVCLYFLIMLLAVVGIPSAILIGSNSFDWNANKKVFEQMKAKPSVLPSASATVLITPLPTLTGDNVKIKVYNHKTKKYFEIGFEEYITGVVAGEMPWTFEFEALKAQAITARSYTYARYIKEIPPRDNEHPESATCTNPNHCQAYVSYEDTIKRLGMKKGNEKWTKLRNAVNATKGVMVMYNGKVANPLFHSCSGGMTEKASIIWGGRDVKYLQPVKSPGEESAPCFSSTVTVDEKKFYEMFSSIKDKIIKGKKENKKYFKILKKGVSGRVALFDVSGCVYRGTDVRTMLKLRSTLFTVKQKNHQIIFSVKGFGHGIGMSQYGANAMAKSGKNYADILKHYYTNIQLKKVY